MLARILTSGGYVFSRRFRIIFILTIFSLLVTCSEKDILSPIPSTSLQLLLMVTDSAKSTRGVLYRFERNTPGGKWARTGKEIPVVIGRHGLGWGKGLHKIPRKPVLPIKKEGDGRSPAGVFKLRSVFGYLPENRMKDLKMPYIHISESSECIDDARSKFYNTIVSSADVDTIDWNSSEKMRSSGICYSLGVFIDHNTNPVSRGYGSCIFLHNWANPNETTSGCTAMSPGNMREIVFWLNCKKEPVLVQLTKNLFIDLRDKWRLPDIDQ